MVRRVSTEMFFRIAYILMFVIAVELIRGSVVNLVVALSAPPQTGRAIAGKAGGATLGSLSALTPPHDRPSTDPLFYAAAVPAVMFLGLSKGGFSGIGMVSTPLLAIDHAAARSRGDPAADHPRQDVVSVWVYRRVWDPWNLKVMIPGCVIGVGRPGCSRPMSPTG
jgi:hypothetical protein